MPKQIGEYEIGKTIGRGKYSKVKYAVHIKSGKPYAMKILNLKEIRREQMETQLRKEIAIMKMIRNEHVVALKDVLQTDRHIYIAMELVTGGELFEKIISAEKFEEDVSRKYFQQLVNAIAHCHAQGIAHRDLKPENLLLGTDDKIKITDFGLSTLAKGRHGKSQILTTTCGTPNYVAPEVLREKGYEGFKADIWSIGIILFVMLTGYLPFDDTDVEKLFRKIESGKLSYPSFLSKGAKSLLQSMLQVDPEKRATLADIKSHQWFLVNYKDPLKSQSQKMKQLTKLDIQNSIRVMDSPGPSSELSTPSSSLTSPSPKTWESRSDESLTAFHMIHQLIGFTGTTLSYWNEAPSISFTILKGTLQEVHHHVLSLLKKYKANPRGKEHKNQILLKCFFFSKDTGTILTFNTLIHPTLNTNLQKVSFSLTKGSETDFSAFLAPLINDLNLKPR